MYVKEDGSKYFNASYCGKLETRLNNCCEKIKEAKSKDLSYIFANACSYTYTLMEIAIQIGNFEYLKTICGKAEELLQNPKMKKKLQNNFKKAKNRLFRSNYAFLSSNIIECVSKTPNGLKKLTDKSELKNPNSLLSMYNRFIFEPNNRIKQCQK